MKEAQEEPLKFFLAWFRTYSAIFSFRPSFSQRFLADRRLEWLTGLWFQFGAEGVDGHSDPSKLVSIENSYQLAVWVAPVQSEHILDVFPAADEQSRVVIAVASQSESAEFVLRQESFSSDVGWFVQSRVTLDSNQMLALKAALTCGRTQMSSVNQRDSVESPAILSFEAAAAAG